jgi:hypothetical protein
VRGMPRTLPLIVLLIAISASLATAEVPQPDSRDKTLVLLFNALQGANPDADLRVNREIGAIETYVDGRPTITSYADNLFLLLRDNTDKLDRQKVPDDSVRSYLETMVEITSPATIDPSNVMPVLRHANYIKDVSGAEVPFQPLVGDLSIYWVLDTPDSMGFLTWEGASNLGMSQKELMALGQVNLTARLPEEDLGGGITMLVLDGNYESSFLVLAPFWEGIDRRLDQVVVAVPARDLVVYADSTDAAAVTALRNAVKARDRAYEITQDLFVWTGTGWEVLSE